MRMMLTITFPTATFNDLWRQGRVGPRIKQILADTKPQAIYFGKVVNGQRGAVAIVDIATPGRFIAYDRAVVSGFRGGD